MLHFIPFHSFSSILSFFSLYGEIVKRVTSDDSGTVEDPEGDTTGDENTTGGNTSGGSTDNTGSGSTIPGEGDKNVMSSEVEMTKKRRNGSPDDRLSGQRGYRFAILPPGDGQCRCSGYHKELVLD